MEKFRWHNQQWLEMVETQSAEDGHLHQYAEDPNGYMQDSEILNQHQLFMNNPGKYCP